MNEKQEDRIDNAKIIIVDALIILFVGGCLLAIAICAVAMVRGA